MIFKEESFILNTFKKCTLSPTSALVLLMDDNASYSHSKTLEYLNALDLSEALPLYEHFNKIWPHSREIIRNRKYAIDHLASQFLSQQIDSQVIIFAAGLNPLSIELSSKFPNATFFDLDLENMNTKEKLMTELNIKNSIRCLSIDLMESENIVTSLGKSGWKRDLPTLIIAEGISYYLPLSSLWKTIDILDAKALIFEYLLPYEQVDKEMVSYPQETFTSLQIKYKLSSITHYDTELLKRCLEPKKGVLKETLDMHSIEQKRFSKNLYFPKQNSGWIEVSDCRYLI